MTLLNKEVDKFFWVIIILSVIVLSVSSIIRIYNIKNLFLSADVRQDAIQANIAMREQYGLGATDLKLTRIESDKDNNVFYFDYRYHHPAVRSDRGRYAVEFRDGFFIQITPLSF